MFSETDVDVPVEVQTHKDDYIIRRTSNRATLTKANKRVIIIKLLKANKTACFKRESHYTHPKTNGDETMQKYHFVSSSQVKSCESKLCCAIAMMTVVSTNGCSSDKPQIYWSVSILLFRMICSLLLPSDISVLILRSTTQVRESILGAFQDLPWLHKVTADLT